MMIGYEELRERRWWGEREGGRGDGEREGEREREREEKRREERDVTDLVDILQG